MSTIPPTGPTPKGCTLHLADELVSSLKVGDKVTIFVPNGIGRNGQEWKEKNGKVVITSGTYAALNMGGSFGTPGVATPDNIVKVGNKYALRQ